MGSPLVLLALLGSFAFPAELPYPFVEIVRDQGRPVSARLKAGDGPGAPLLAFHGVALTDPSYDYSRDGLTAEKMPGKLKELFGANFLRVALDPEPLRPKGRHRGVYIDEAALAAAWSVIDSVRAGAAPLGMYVAVDLHAIGHPNGAFGPSGYLADPELAEEFWSRTAERYKDRPEVVFELFNEPFGSPAFGSVSTLTQKYLSDYYAHLVGEIVKAGSTRNLIILSGLEYSSDLSGFAREPLESVKIVDASGERQAPVASRIAYGVHFYPSRPNTGGPRSGQAAVAAAMRAAMPSNLAVIVSEWGMDPTDPQDRVLGVLGALGRMTPDDFLARFAAGPELFDRAKLPALLKRFDFAVPGRPEEFSRDMYDGRMIQDLVQALTPEGMKALGAHGFAGLIRSADQAADPSDVAALKTLHNMPYSLELTDKPGYREALCEVMGSDGSCVVWTSAKLGGLLESGRFGAGMSPDDLSGYGKFLRKLFDGARN